MPTRNMVFCAVGVGVSAVEVLHLLRGCMDLSRHLPDKT